MKKIRIWSLAAQLLLLVMITVQIGSYCLVAFSGVSEPSESGMYVYGIDENNQYTISHSSSTWRRLNQVLPEYDLNPFVWLSGPEMLFEVCFYLLLFLLFRTFMHGQVFTLKTIGLLKRCGALCLGWAVMMVIYPAILVLFLRFTQIAPIKKLVLEFGIEEMNYLLIGTLMYVAAVIMQQAIILRQEQELVI